MAWTGLMLTVGGRSALNQAQQSNRINFKSIVVGDGMPPANFSTLKGLVHQLYELTELKIDVTENGCILTADFPNVEYDYYFREVGVIAETEKGDVLYVYDNCGADAQYIVNSTGAEATQKRLRLSLIISDVSEITVSVPSILYVAYDNFEKTVQELGQADTDIAAALQEENDRAVEKERLLEAQLSAEITRAKEAEEANEDAIEREKARATSAEDFLKKIIDTNKPVWDGAYQQAAGYTDQKIAELINGAPDTLDTLGEIASAMQENTDIVGVLEDAIGAKADQKEMERLLELKLEKAGDAKDNTVTYTSGDAESFSAWTNVPVLKDGEKFSVIMNRVSTMFKNVRYLFKMLGTTDISAIGGGTVTGAVSKLNTDLGSKQDTKTAINTSNIGQQSVNYATSAGSSSSATKAAQDGAGNNISNTYAKLNTVPTFAGLELSQSTPHIDFHYGSSSADYTSRIIEQSNNVEFNCGNNNTKDLVVRCKTLQSKNLSGSFQPVYASAFTVNSSRRVKKNIRFMTTEEARKILDLQIVDYDYINGDSGQHGLIAEDAVKILPNIVLGDISVSDNDTEGIAQIGIDYSRLVPYLVKMVQLQQIEIEDLKHKVE